MPRPKGSKKISSSSLSRTCLSTPTLPILLSNLNDFLINKGDRPKKIEYEENLISINSSNEINGGGRVVINPAVLRYLEQNRTYKPEDLFNKTSTIEINEQRENLLSNIHVQETTSINDLIQDELFWNFCACSTEFLTSARLAQWLLTYQKN